MRCGARRRREEAPIWGLGNSGDGPRKHKTDSRGAGPKTEASKRQPGPLRAVAPARRSSTCERGAAQRTVDLPGAGDHPERRGCRRS